MKIIARAAFLVLTVCLAHPLWAESSAKELLRVYQAGNARDRHDIEKMLAATENGMGWHSVMTKVEVYCLPKNLALTGNQIVDILQRQAKDSALISESPYGLATIMALKQTFPCLR